MRLLLLGVVVAVAAAGCTKPNPASCADHHCSDPARPFCDEDGTIGGEPQTCIAVSCTAGEFAECRGDAALTCNATGDSYDLLECPYGCGDTGCLPCTTPDCEKHIIPKYLPAICDSLAADATLDVTVNTDFDTDGTQCTSVATQSTGPAICVLHYGTITIERNIGFRPYGMRAIALVADRELLIDGTLDVGGDVHMFNQALFTRGPGGSTKRSGAATSGAGGGGAGNRTAGGAGATTTVDGAGSNAGPAEMNPAALSELFGGTHGGTDTSSGGAATLISCRATVRVPGLVDAAGGGGNLGYRDFNNAYHEAEGGASGGNVVIQGMAVDIEGELYSNGGAGGGGGYSTSVLPGDRGPRSTFPASGGAGDLGASGGAGGTGAALPATGHKGTNGGGAGGGSTGFLLTYTPSGISPTIATTAKFSPALEPNGTIATN